MREFTIREFTIDAETVGIGDPPMIAGVCFDCSGEPRREVVQVYADEILERARARGMNIGHPNFILLGVSMEPCGGRATYRTADDIPLVDTPCPCGDPSHWLVKWSEEKGSEE